MTGRPQTVAHEPRGDALTARAMDEGRALRTAGLRHRRLLDAPLQIVAWQYGVEPFTVGALALRPADRPL